MNQTQCQFTLPFRSDRKITVAFDGGRISSDAGLALLYAVDRSQGFSRGFSRCLKDRRDARYVRHSVEALTTQRLLQIAAGYEDCNDADSLRSDAGLKSFCDRLPESGPDLGSTATLCRLENGVGWAEIRRLSQWLLKRYVRKLRKSRRRRVVLDFDSTDDPTHGQQEFSFYHGYFRNRVYHPLLVFDAETGDLICALLRAGNRGASSHAVAVLKRVVRMIRRQIRRSIQIEVRGDCGFATPALYAYCEAHQLDYVIGFTRNPRLEAAVQPLVEQAQSDFEQEAIQQRRFTDFLYQAQPWDCSRRIVAKVEYHSLGLNRRFVVTNRCDLTAQQLYDHYVERGQSENYIKAFKNDLAMDRLSCHRFVANQFRLLLHALAYQLFLALRDYLYGTAWQHLQIQTLRRRILKIGARIRETSRRIWIHCSSSYPEQQTFLLVLQRICARPG